MEEIILPKIKKAEKEAEYIKLKAIVEELDRIAKLLIRRDLELSETREKLELSLIELENKNIELQQKIEEMGTMNRMMIGRELKMIELKKEKEELKSKLKEEQ
ncbi:MAG: hypothetical protein AAB620_00245 [Patescibacteria group bacterium]